MKEIITLIIGILIGAFLIFWFVENTLNNKAEEICKNKLFPAETGWFKVENLDIICQDIDTYILKRH